MVAVLLILATALFSAYCAVVVASSVDSILFPGNEIELPQVSVGVPGVGALQFDVPLTIPDLPIPALRSRSRPLASVPALRDEPIMFLVLGLDRTLDYAPESDPGRSDTIFIVSLDPQTKKAALLNFPRDTWLEVPDVKDGGWTLERLNTAYPDAERAGRSGPRAVMETMKHNFGLELRHYVTVDWRGFTRIVDALNGIDIYVREDLYDPGSTVLKPFGWRLKRGSYHFSGAQALAYSRYRADSDLHRIERQHQVIRALLKRAASAEILANPLRVWNTYRDTVETDINTVQIPGLALLARQIGTDRVRTYSLGDAAEDYLTPGGGQVLLLDPKRTSEILQRAVPAALSGGLVVEVRNAGGSPGWASRVRQHLIDRGAPAVFLVARDNPLSGEYRQTVLLNYSGDPELVRRLAESLALPEERVLQANQFIGEFQFERLEADIIILAAGDLTLPDDQGRTSSTLHFR